MSQVPAATRALRVLRFLATQADPVPLDRVMRACDLPRSTAYHLLNTMIAEGFVVHLPDEPDILENRVQTVVDVERLFPNVLQSLRVRLLHVKVKRHDRVLILRQ